MGPRQQLIGKFRLIQRASPNDEPGVAQRFAIRPFAEDEHADARRLDGLRLDGDPIERIRNREQARSSGVRSSVNHSASLGSSGVKTSRSVSIRKRIGEKVIGRCERRTRCLDPPTQIAVRSRSRRR